MGHATEKNFIQQMVLHGFINEQKAKELFNNKYDWICELHKGQTFGATGIQSRSNRTASVVCKEDCMFLTLDSMRYRQTLINFSEAKKIEKIKFINSFELFRHWTVP